MPFDRSVVPDQDAAEKRLVHHAALLVRCLLVSGPALCHEVEGAAHGDGHGVHLGVGTVEQGLGSGQLAGDALLPQLPHRTLNEQLRRAAEDWDLSINYLVVKGVEQYLPRLIAAEELTLMRAS